MIIAVTGTPGTGKTTLAKKIAKLGFTYVDAKKLIKRKNISEYFDKENKCYVVDEKKLAREIVNEIGKIKKSKKKNNYKKLLKILSIAENKINEESKDVVIDSHLSHYVLKKYIDLVVVTKCNIDCLRKRLQKRKYSSSKIQDNLDSELFDVCATEAKELGHRVIYFGN